jgi:aldehyde dehydrogenase (NAD+)/phenylacetaldehyde dehydrogenase
LTAASPIAGLREDVQQFLGRDPIPMFVDGKERLSDSGRYLTVIDPSFGTEIARIAEAGESDVLAAVDAARRALTDSSWPKLTPGERGAVLWRLAELIERDGDALGQLDALDCGLPYPSATAHEIAAVADDLRYFAGWATKLQGRTIPAATPGAVVYTVRGPVGVCAAITSWNFPMEGFSGKVGPALAAGNTVVLKPAEHASMSAIWLARLASEAGCPPGVLNVVTGGADVGTWLVRNPGVNKVAFTGSTQVGRSIAAAAGEGLKRVSLELGGKSPMVVCADADFEGALRAAGGSVFFHSGQNCVAASRLIVEKQVFEDVVGRLSALAEALHQGPAFEPDIEIGPVISRQRQDAILGYVEQSKLQGARVVAGGAAPLGVPAGGFYVAPTVLIDVPDGARVAQEEVFGPVVVVSPFETIDDAVTLANATDYGLGASIWTRDVDRSLTFAERAASGVVWVNGHAQFDSAAPYGGVKQSGIGSELGEAALDEYTTTKTVWLNPSR